MKDMAKENRLVVADVGWADTIPEWLLDEVRIERLIHGMGSMINPDIPRVGDAEVCVYLLTASQRAPMYPDQNEVYFYLTAVLMKKKGMELPDFLEEKLKNGLRPDEERELERLRSMIYDHRGGEINHPMLNIMRSLKKDIDKQQEKIDKTDQKTIEEMIIKYKAV